MMSDNEKSLETTHQTPEAVSPISESIQPVKKNWLDIATIAILSSLISILVISPFIYKGYKLIPRKIAVVDVQKLVEENQSSIISRMQKNNGIVSDEERNDYLQRTANFAKSLSVTLEELEKNCHCVLLNKAALLTTSTSGVVDYTDKAREILQK